jgi:iron complex transport system substrate-binding protein
MTTRSALMAALLTAAISLVACGTDDPAPPEPAAPTGTTRTVDHAAGTTQVPADPQRLVVTDEYAALLVLGLEARPEFTFTGLRSRSLGGVIASAGVPTGEFDVKQPDFEAIAAQRPDLIMTTATVDPTMFYDRYSAIAPTVVVPYTAEWREQLRIAASALGRVDQAETIVAELKSRIGDLAARLRDAGKAGTTVSVIGDFGGQLYAVPNTTLVAQLLAELGLDRPVAQDAVGPAEAGGYLYFGAENLIDHDADVVLVQGGGAGYDPSAITDSPLAQRFSGTVVVVNGELWNGSHPLAVTWILEDLEAVLLGEGAVGTEADAQARWEGLTA